MFGLTDHGISAKQQALAVSSNLSNFEMEIETIYPLIVRSTYYAKNVWDLPHQKFPNKDYILTWVFFGNERSMSYIKRSEYDLLSKTYSNWQQIAFENLRISGSQFYTSYRKDDVNDSLSCVIFGNEDGIGSSRILFSKELSEGFPEGYYISMPDRAVGVAMSKNLSETEQIAVSSIIDEYYGCSGTAMSKLIFEPAELLLPDSWIQPIDPYNFEWMVEEIRSYKDV